MVRPGHVLGEVMMEMDIIYIYVYNYIYILYMSFRPRSFPVVKLTSAEDWETITPTMDIAVRDIIECSSSRCGHLYLLRPD